MVFTLFLTCQMYILNYTHVLDHLWNIETQIIGFTHNEGWHHPHFRGQYHGCCWRHEVMGQGISTRGIEFILPQQSGLGTKRVKLTKAIDVCCYALPENVLGMNSANERRCYTVPSHPIGWAHTRNDPWLRIANKTIHIPLCFGPR